MDALIQAPLTFLTDSIVFRGHQTSSQNFTSGAYLVLNFDATDEDPYGGWSATSTGSQAAHSWLAPYTGWYQVTFTFSWTPSTATYGRTAVLIDGLTQYQLGGGDAYSGVTGSYDVPLVGTVDYIQMQGVVEHTGLSTLVSTAGFQPSCEITFISQ